MILVTNEGVEGVVGKVISGGGGDVPVGIGRGRENIGNRIELKRVRGLAEWRSRVNTRDTKNYIPRQTWDPQQQPRRSRK